MHEANHPIQPQRLRQLLRKMVDIYSPSGKEEEILDFLHSYLKRHGLPVTRQAVDDYRDNLVVMPPNGEASIVFIGHLDTVVAYDLDHYGCEEQGDLITGLGTADMKGGCAAMVEAFISVWETGCSHAPAALALVVGEEEDGDGAQRFVREYHFPWAIIGEPTNLTPSLSHYGYLEIHLTTRGQRMHASLANMGQNPIKAMLHLLLRISNHMDTIRPDLVYNIRELTSSQAGFAVPDRCDTWLDVHLPPTAPIGEIMLELEELVAREHQENPLLDADLRFVTIHSGYELPEKGKLVETLKTIYASHALNWKPEPFRSHSDANLIWAAGIKPIILGCGRLEAAHAPHEAVSFEQVCHTARVYRDLMVSLCQRPETAAEKESG